MGARDVHNESAALPTPAPPDPSVSHPATPSVFAPVALQRDPATTPSNPGLLVVHHDLVAWHETPAAPSPRPSSSPLSPPPPPSDAVWQARFADIILHALAAAGPDASGAPANPQTHTDAYADADADADAGARAGTCADANGDGAANGDAPDNDADAYADRPCLLAHIGDEGEEVRFFGAVTQLHALYEAFCAGMARCAPDDADGDGDGGGGGGGGGNAVSGLFGALGALAGLASSPGATVDDGDGEDDGEGDGGVLPLSVGGVSMDDERFADADEDDAVKVPEKSLANVVWSKAVVSGEANGNGHGTATEPGAETGNGE